MEYDELKSFVQRILDLEFCDRDHEIQVNATGLKAEMNSRGLLNSTITLSNLSEFFLAEFKARCDLIAQHAIGRIAILKTAEGSDKTPLGLFRSIADEQLTRVLIEHDSISMPIASSLLSGMPVQIRDSMVQRMRDHMKQNELTVELECKAATSAKPSEVFVLKPSLYGIGVDLKELWKRFLN